ncbi:MAG: hypothetical protein IPL78_18135 [Chloroflexi bacterium]|nr:hypothetical protein [Chloroflexota bacterium]
MRNNTPSKSLVPVWLSFSLAAAFVISGLTVTILAYLTVQEMLAAPLNPLDPLIADGGNNGDPNAGVATLPPPVNLEEPLVLPEATPLPIYPINEQRVTILLMGIDRRPGDAFVSRTDTMIVDVHRTRQTIRRSCFPFLVIYTCRFRLWP